MAKKFKIDDYTKGVDNPLYDRSDKNPLLERSFANPKSFGAGGLLSEISLPATGFQGKIRWSDIDDNNNLRPVKMYDAVVSKDGSGHYIQIQDAINDGKRRIFVRSGTYFLNSHITLVNDLIIIGENKYTTIIDCNNNDYRIDSNASGYATGTIAITNNSTTITGTGTAWTANLNEEDFILINGVDYIIDTVTNNTSLEITTNYRGDTLVGLDYLAGDLRNNVFISELTIRNYTTTSALHAPVYIRYSINSFYENLIIKKNTISGVLASGIGIGYSYNMHIGKLDIQDSQTGVYVSYSGNNTFTEINSYNNSNTGVDIGPETVNNTFNKINCVNNGIGLRCTNGSISNKVLQSNFSFNNAIGLDIQGEYYTFQGCGSHNNGTQGVYLRRGYNVLSGCVIKNNQEEGILIYSSSYNTIVSNTIIENSQAGSGSYDEINISGISSAQATHNIISGNQIITVNGDYGIKEDASVNNYNIITSNLVEGAVTKNILIQGVKTEVGHNIH